MYIFCFLAGASFFKGASERFGANGVPSESPRRFFGSGAS